MLLDGNHLSLGIAYVAGLTSFFAPCVVPLLPAYVAYFTGLGAADTDDRANKIKLFSHTLIFVLGFLVIFLLLGMSSTWIGSLLAHYKMILSRVGGVVLIVLGLYLLGVFKNPALYRERKLNLHAQFTRYQSLNVFVLGLTFGFAWTPCIGPVLAVILLWTSQAATLGQGFLLMLAFGLGIGSPFLLVSVFLDKLMPWIRKTQRLQQIVHMASGYLILIIGFLLLTNLLTVVTAPLTNLGSLELFLIDRL
ncbi:cytochrome C biogenesis protein [Candidatus Uhrbacteria bacterium CG10_big_fil_rev_8_21_14_0_10_50_16]|uniref:Cytochrome C biogenesis protein n=1 Tax=Candidatus Uhrbacteria bacterium CG10_big_fil_rev_8_21_14_0_10_50_16 TaxID=1975039 RepID=A0A2H0RNU1_9BACT|nr:MAG: cytochrome C biogenesis protein [Candidatus Uhrbacteria bacterium CG10_big_fil_rev_8_21_14_0_10_50_16]